MSTEVCVEGFPPTVTEQELKDLFSACGTVLSIQMETTEEGHPMGFAEVVMANQTEADNAMEALHLVYLHGRLLLVFDDYACTDHEQTEASLRGGHEAIFPILSRIATTATFGSKDNP